VGTMALPENSHTSHMVENGDLCICGKRGCLETIASSNTIMKRVQQGFRDNEISSLLNKFKDMPEKIISGRRYPGRPVKAMNFLFPSCTKSALPWARDSRISSSC
jgi:predicted NBD/HSP70 family sugar kinase